MSIYKILSQNSSIHNNWHKIVGVSEFSDVYKPVRNWKFTDFDTFFLYLFSFHEKPLNQVYF
jgi:hypothetical protein